MNGNEMDALEEKIRAASHAVEPAPAFREQLWNKMQRQALPQQASPRRWWAQPGWATGLAVLTLALVIALVGPQRVAAAFQGLLGYLPGIGFVQAGDDTGYIGSYVAAEQDGVRWVIDQAVADETQTVIAFHFEGLPQGAQCVYNENRFAVNGRATPPMGGESSLNEGVFHSRLIFGALPEGVRTGQLSVTLDDASDCPAPAQWQTELTFGALPAHVTLAAVSEKPATALPAAAQPAEASGAQDLAAGSASNGLRLVVEKTVELADGVVLSGSVAWNPDAAVDGTILEAYPDFSTAQIVDADGRSVPFEPSDEASDGQHWGVKVLSRDFKAPLTVQVRQMQVMFQPRDAAFSFDPGSAPSVGQTWTLDESMNGLAAPVKALSAQAVHEPLEAHFTNPDDVPALPADAVNGYVFTLQVGDAVQNLGLGLPESAGVVMQEARRSADDRYEVSVYSAGAMPGGPMQVQVQQVALSLAGDWQTSVEVNGQ